LVSHTKGRTQIYRPEREEATGGWRTLQNEELYNLYDSPNIIRVMKSRLMGWTGNVGRMGDIRNSYKVSVAKPEGKISL